MEKPTHLRRPERAGNPHIHDSVYRRVRTANNADAMRPIEPQPVPRRFKGPAVNKASRRAG